MCHLTFIIIFFTHRNDEAHKKRMAKGKRWDSKSRDADLLCLEFATGRFNPEKGKYPVKLLWECRPEFHQYSYGNFVQNTGKIAEEVACLGQHELQGEFLFCHFVFFK